MGGKALVIGYGNPLRGDDGIGQAVAQAIAAEADAPDVTVVFCQQLTPELAESLAGAAFAVFVDAVADAPAGSIRTSAQHATALPASGIVHHLDPGALLTLAVTLYGSAARTVLVAVGADAMEIGEGLSPAVANALPRAVATVRRLLAEYRAGEDG